MDQAVVTSPFDIQTKIHVKDGNVTFERIQDCEPFLEYAKAMHNEGHHGSSDLRYAAHIPDVIIEKYCNDNNLTFHEFINNRDHIKRICNDPSLSGFRIWKGRL